MAASDDIGGQAPVGSGGAIRPVLIAVKIMEELGSGDELGVSELSRRLGLPKATVQRGLASLQAAGWLAASKRQPTKWRFSSGMLLFVSRIRETYDLRVLTRSTLEDLRDETAESVQLVIPHDGFVVSVEKVESPQAVRAYSALGQPLPMQATAGGKAILSCMENGEIRAMFEGTLPRYTSKTITDIGSLMAELEHARVLGYAVNLGEWRKGVSAVGSPIVVDDRPVAAIVISAPAERMDSERLKYLGSLVAERTRNLAVLG